MAFKLERFSELRPYLYHLTSRANVERIRRSGQLECAATLLEMAGQGDWVRRRRRDHLLLDVDGAQVVIRDQTPLHAGNTCLEDGWVFGDLVERLNTLVFFWPGDQDGPIGYGTRHFSRYQTEETSIIRVSTVSLLATPGATPLFCRYNSGSPRCSNGKRSPRGPRTFLPANEVDFSSGAAVEVVFELAVGLPPGAEWWAHPEGPWRSLSTA